MRFRQYKGCPIHAGFIVMGGIAAFFIASTLPAQQPFTLQQVLSAPYALSLTAAPVGARFAWVENAEGVRNLWVGGPSEPAHVITHYTSDDAQDIDGLAWSPDATAIAYTYGAESGADGRPANPAHLQRATALQVIVQPLAANATALVIGEGHAPLFTRDGKSLLFLRAGQVWIAPLAPPDGKTCWLPEGCSTSAPATSAHQLVFDRGSASSLTLSPDGNILAFISRRPTTSGPAHTFLALYNLTTHELAFPAASTGNDSAPAFSPDGKQIAWLRAPFTRQAEYTPHISSPNPWSIQLLDLTTNTTRTVFSPEPDKPGSILPHMATGEPRLFFATDNRIVFFSEADKWIHLYSLDLNASSKKPVLLTPQEGDVEDATLSHDGTMIWSSNRAECETAGYTTGNYPMGGKLMCNGEARDRRHLWHWNGTDTQNFTSGYGIETRPVSAVDGTLAALISDAHTPMQPALIGKDGSIRPLHLNANLSTYPADQLVTPKQVLFPSPREAEGAGAFRPLNTSSEKKGAIAPDSKTFTIHSQLFLSPHLSAGKHPAIIFVHGGPNRQMLLGYPGMDYYSNAYAMNQYLASRGFIVLSVNYRGGIGYGLNFREAAHYGPNGASEYNDVLAAQKYLASRADVDSSRIGIWGGSYGGFLTALALARNSNLFAAGVDFHGVHEWSLEGNADRFMPDPAHATAAQHDAAAALAHSSSPMADVDHWRSPVLLIHGDNDPDVAYAQTPTLADALRARHVPIQELIFPDEVHGFLLHKDWLAAYQAAADFFERTLKP